jgi:major membrane immunogen (membrane-anchored lipoprotein)
MIFKLFAVFPALLLSACSGIFSGGFSPFRGGDRFFDGYYTAEALFFDSYGWKEFVSVYINQGRIVTVDYDAKNASGFIKSWDMEYMRRMNASSGTYPNKYTRGYALALLNWQDPQQIDVLTGATDSYFSFKLLAAAVLNQARAGNRGVAFVAVPGIPEHEE